jgi:hypothetical protein
LFLDSLVCHKDVGAVRFFSSNESMKEVPNTATLRVIRRITADQILELEEVMDLAGFLNDSRAARHSWPGKVLWKTLESVFEDGEISEEELAAIGSILQDIEHECAGVEDLETEPIVVNSESAEAIRSVKDEGFMIPESVTGFSMQTEAGQLYSVQLGGPTCECGDWTEKRSRLPERDPGRICKHVAMALRDQLRAGRGDEWPSAFRGMVEELADMFRGTAPDSEWRLLRVNEQDFLMVLNGADWAHVYGPTEGEKVERFSYRRRDHRWFFGAKPANANLIAAYIDTLKVEV